LIKKAQQTISRSLLVARSSLYFFERPHFAIAKICAPGGECLQKLRGEHATILGERC
jgi:hypothetical protein